MSEDGCASCWHYTHLCKLLALHSLMQAVGTTLTYASCWHYTQLCKLLALHSLMQAVGTTLTYANCWHYTHLCKLLALHSLMQAVGTTLTYDPALNGKCTHIHDRNIHKCSTEWVGRDSSVGITTCYGLDCPGSNPGGGEIFHTSPDRPLGPNQHPIQ
jgi:hypothetical protein